MNALTQYITNYLLAYRHTGNHREAEQRAIEASTFQETQVFVAAGSVFVDSKFIEAQPIQTPLPSGKKNVGAIVTQTGAGEGIPINEGEPVSAGQLLTAKTVAVRVPISNDAIRYATQIPDPLVVADVNASIGQVLDANYLEGDGTTQTDSILTRVAAANILTSVDFDTDVQAMALTIGNAAIDLDRLCWFMSPEDFVNGTQSDLYGKELSVLHTLMGWPVKIVPALATNGRKFLVSMDAAVVGLHGGLPFAVDLAEKTGGFQSDYSQLRVMVKTDLALRATLGAVVTE